MNMRNKVKVYRKAANLTQEELALKLSVTRQTINAIENNKYNPTLELAIKMARFLCVPVEELFVLE
ncbi:transcriptional regulator, XRE family [Pseudobacteroides cellulosolvens ATCC 35603 = DSM 2933]|uniref:Transcriptional regulator, XRE family n=2 Tax=Pseudobacteroides cellulosolvens TaxID=35825 RepID=A0A0L6JUX2_9FIRM|nr:transcriptional regulator, XRE family [Pseudobacteroides cellulosolvens ATCC 35603 = DSM 2933]